MTNRNNPRDRYRPRNPIAKNLMEEKDGLYRLRTIQKQQDRYKRHKLHPKDVNIEDEDYEYKDRN